MGDRQDQPTEDAQSGQLVTPKGDADQGQASGSGPKTPSDAAGEAPIDQQADAERQEGYWNRDQSQTGPGGIGTPKP